MSILKNKYKLYISIFLLLSFHFLRHFLFYDRGLSLNEEGLPFYVYNSIAKGELLYKDVYNYTSPVSNYFYTLIVKVFGSELLTIRAASIIISSLGLLIIFFILRQFLNYFWSWIGTVISYCLYFLWFYKYGLELGSLFSYLSIFSLYFYIKRNKKLYFILTILFSVGAFGHHIYTQGIPLFLSILSILIIFYKRINYKYIIIYFFSVIFINFSLLYIFIYKSSLSRVIYNLVPFLYADAPIGRGKLFPFFNVFDFFNVKFPDNFNLFSIYLPIKGLLYSFIYYLPIINLFLFKVNYSNVYKKLDHHLRFLFISLLFYSLFSTVRFYMHAPSGHSDAFLVSPSILFFYLNFYYILKNVLLRINSKFILKITKVCIIFIIIVFYSIIQIPNLNPELNEKEFTHRHIKGVKFSGLQVDFINAQIDTIEKYSERQDYVYTGDLMLNVITETISPLQDRFYFVRPILSAKELNNPKFLTKENIEKIENEFVDILIDKQVKVICLHSDHLKVINQYNLERLKNLLDTKYTLKNHIIYDQSKQTYVIDTSLDMYIFVLNQNQ